LLGWLVLFITGCTAPLRLNEVQLIGSHNSFKQAIDPELLQQLAAFDKNLAASLEYSHLTIPAQLGRGIRKFELDVFYDPEGGRYQTPGGLTRIATARPYDVTSLGLPGFKVMHVQDIDFRSHCPLLTGCLQQFVTWSNEHPNHLPVFITINPKEGAIDVPGFVQPLPFDDRAWDELDTAFRQGLGDKLFTPDEFRADELTLPDAVAKGWPTLESMRGRFILVLDHGNERMQQYVKGHPALTGRSMFVNSVEGTPEAAIRVINDPVKDGDKIRQLVQQGYIVRTRSDADTVEARTGDTNRREQAFLSGAQIISTDYYLANPAFGTGFSVKFPDGGLVRCNPVLRPNGCELKE
jgi:hypothetical protein